VLKKLIYVYLFVFILISQEYSADFLRLDVGAKTIASGNSFFLNTEDIAAYRWFPADYTYYNKRKVYSSVSSRFSGLVKQVNFGFSQPVIGGYNVTFNWAYSGVSDIGIYGLLDLDTDGRPKQTSPLAFSQNDNHIFSLTLGRMFSEEIDIGWDYFILPIKIPIALNINYLRSTYSNIPKATGSTTLRNVTGNGLTIDLSFAVSFNLGALAGVKDLGEFSYYINMANFVGSSISWDVVETSSDERNFEKIANNFITGINFVQPIESIKLNFGFSYQYQRLYGDNSLGFMAEYDKLVELRLGFNNDLFTSGLGVNYYDVGLFIAYSPDHDLGKTLNLDLSYAF
jgi:hypothetical protein